MSHSRIARGVWLMLGLLLTFLMSACGAAATPPAPNSISPAGQPQPAAPTAAPAAAAQPTFFAPAPTIASAAIRPAQPTSAPAAQAAGTPVPSPNSGPGSTSPIDRRIIKNSQLSMTVYQIDEAVFRLTGISADVGGYLISNRVFVEGARRHAQVTMAVPVDRFEEALNLVRKIAYSIESDMASSADVTEQFTDLQSRLRNLEATAVRIRDFLSKATTVEESLKINAQLSEVDRQIEEIKGKLNVMTARTTFSTITADLREYIPPPTTTPTLTATPTTTPTPTPTATPSPTPNVWRPDETIKAAVDAQTTTLSTLTRTVGDALIWFVIFALPYLLVLAFILLVIWRIAGRFSTKPTPPSQPTQSGGEHASS